MIRFSDKDIKEILKLVEDEQLRRAVSGDRSKESLDYRAYLYGLEYKLRAFIPANMRGK